MYKRCRLEEPQRLSLFIQDEFSVEVCCGIIRALQSFQTQVENFPLETSFKDVLYLESHKKGCSDYLLKCEMSTSDEGEEKEPKEQLEEEHEELYPEVSAGSKKQKQRDSIRTDNCANMNLFKCDKCKYNFKRTNELEDHFQDCH